MPLNLLTWLLALSPILVVLILMLGFKWGGSKAGGAAFLYTLYIALMFWGLGLDGLAVSQARGVFLSLDVLLIIWAALLLYHTTDQAGAVRSIGAALTRLTPDRMMQGLLLGWVFASFLQGMGGFGVPVAVAAPLLVGLGFGPVEAVVMSSVGIGWAVNFGSMGTSFQTLIAATGLPGEALASQAGILLGLASFACGALVALIAGGWKGLLRGLPAVGILTVVMGGVQYFLVTNRLWVLGATGGAMAGLLSGVLLCRIPLYQRILTGEVDAAGAGEAGISQDETSKKRSTWISFSAYGVLLVLAFGINLIPELNEWLSRVSLSLVLPETVTSLGVVTASGSTRAIEVFSHPGMILLYASIVAYGIYRLAGYYTHGAVRRILQKTGKGALNSSLGILAMVGMAMVMSASGMTQLLAEGLARGVGRSAYAGVAPLIGAVGAFITGSNNNSNVLFAALQMQTAGLLGLSVPWILAAQTAGGSLGSIMAPAKVIVGCSTVGLGNQEGKVMGRVLLYGMVPVVVVAIIAFAVTC